MDTALINNEITIRLSFFILIFGIMSAWELIAPCRELTVSKPKRWLNNIAIVVLNTLIVRLIFPLAAIGMALLADERQWGLFHYIELPYWLAIIASIIILDFIIYLQHVMFHAIPLLWRLHMMHHADLDIDITTGARFHPIEIIISMLIKFAAIILIGVPATAVIIFEVLLNATSMFNHSNIRIKKSIDKLLRLIVVTPDMHRVHHSVLKRETNSNFGFNLPWWDRLFGTYREQPTAGHQVMTIGLEYFRELKYLSLHRMLALPFISKGGNYPMMRRDKNN